MIVIRDCTTMIVIRDCNAVILCDKRLHHNDCDKRLQCSNFYKTIKVLTNFSDGGHCVFSDMTFTHEGNKTYFNSLVNFEKMVIVW